MNKITIEVASAHGCASCAKAKETIQNMVKSMKNVSVKEISLVDNPEFAVEHGIMATPAIVINGKLKFRHLPTEQELKEALKSYGGGDE